MKYRECDSDENINRLKDRDALIEKTIREFDHSGLVLAEWKSRLQTYYELYQMVQRKKHYSGLASIFVPEILRAVETVTAKLYQMIFSQSDWMQYAGRDNNGDDGPALALTELVNYQMVENGFKSRVMDSLRQMVLSGLTVRKILWDFQEVKRRKAATLPDGSRGSKPQIDTIKDTWTFEPVDLLTFHISAVNVPYNDVQKAEWIGEQYVVTKQHIVERMKRGWYSSIDEEELEEIGEAPSSKPSADVERRLNTSGYLNLSKKGKVEIIERWGLVPAELVLTQEKMDEEGLEGEDLIEGVIVIANRCAILKLEVNPFWHNQKPYVICPYIAKEFEFAGMGVAQIGESLQEEINDTRNQTMDNKTLVLATMWLKSRASGIKNQDLIVRPNGVIVTNDMNGLQPLRPPMVTGVGTNMEAVAKNDLRESVGAASNLQGIAQSGVSTATESTQINRESMGRLLISAQLYAELVLRPTFIFAEYLNYQFYDHIKVINVVGKNGVKFKKMTPEEIAGGSKDVIIKIALDATENPAVMRQQLQGFFTSIAAMPPQAIAFHYKLLDKLYGMFFNGHCLDELYPSPTPEQDELLTAEEERDCCLAEQPVLAQPGQDHRQYLQYLVKEYEQMKRAMNPVQFELMTRLIHSHQDAMHQELQQQTAQLAMQQAAMQQEAQGGGQGTAPNANPHTQTQAPSTSSLAKQVGM